MRGVANRGWKTEAEWRVVGRYVKAFALAVGLNEEGKMLFEEGQTFLPGSHPYHVPNFVGMGEEDEPTGG